MVKGLYVFGGGVLYGKESVCWTACLKPHQPHKQNTTSQTWLPSSGVISPSTHLSVGIWVGWKINWMWLLIPVILALRRLHTRVAVSSEPTSAIAWDHFAQTTLKVSLGALVKLCRVGMRDLRLRQQGSPDLLCDVLSLATGAKG